MNTIAAVFIYHLVVRQRGNTAAYLIGWGVIIPLSWYLPYCLLPHLKVENAAIVFGFLSFPAYVPFRCLEGTFINIRHIIHDTSLMPTNFSRSCCLFPDIM